MFMGYPTNPINYIKEKCFDGYFLIHSSSPKTDEDVTIISSVIGFLKEYFNKIFFNGIDVLLRRKVINQFLKMLMFHLNLKGLFQILVYLALIMSLRRFAVLLMQNELKRMRVLKRLFH